MTLSIEARLARCILMSQDHGDGDELVLTQEFLSTMLGVRRPGATMAAHVLEGTGVIRAGRGRNVVLDRDRLKEIAGDAHQVAEDEYERITASA